MAVRSDKVSRVEVDGLTLVEGVTPRVRFAFTERTGGVSEEPYSSLNLGTHVGDDPFAVAENRRRVLEALGAASCEHNLLVPNQVHGDRIVTVVENGADYLEDVREQLAEGCDAVVCTVPDVPVMLCFADCAPVVLVAPGGFAVAHSGWKGTFARIAGKTALALAASSGCDTRDIKAYIGPHILGDEYEVSTELIEKFAASFENVNPAGPRLLDLSSCIVQSLVEAGVRPCDIHDLGLSTMRHNDRFFSYRAENGTCGRHAAVAVLC